MFVLLEMVNLRFSDKKSLICFSLCKNMCTFADAFCRYSASNFPEY